MRRILLFCLALVCLLSVAPTTILRADFPKPSVYPISYELALTHGKPQRIVVQAPGEATATAYWYMTYTVTNNSDQEQVFLPRFEILSEDGRVTRSDTNIPAAVFDAIKAREKKQLLEPFTKIAGEIRLGEDQARDGVAIFPEPSTRMGHFSIFVAGLSGEAVTLKDDKGEPVKDKDGQLVILRKTLRLNYHVRGDEVFPGEDEVSENAEEWVMR
jgi:hypothetical protein